MDDREKFEKYADRVNEMLRSEDFYANFRRRLRASRPEFKLNRKDRKKHFEMDWIEMIESCIVNLDNIVRNPRKFIVIEEDIVDISLARAISTESIKHLAQHTNMIAAVDEEGNVTPNKILNTTKEESFEVYENRFIYTLLKNLSNFVTRRLDAIKMSYVNDHILELTAKGNFFMGKTRVFCNFEIVGSLPTDPEQEAEQSRDVEILQRVTKLQRVISDFLSSPFAKQMVNSAPVRPPITRTNVILKNPDFKKALVLWQFIESYTKMGFQVENDIKKMPVDEKVDTMISDMMCLSNMIMEGLIHGEVQDMAFFDEANMTEEEEKEKEQVEQAEKKEEAAPEEEKEKETDVPPVQEEVAQTVPDEEQTEEQSEDQTEEPPETQDEESRPEKEEEQEQEGGEDEELPSDFGIAEIRNLFQQTDAKVTKAELRRINLAIDRVLLAERTVSAKQKTEVAEIQARQEGLEAERLRKQLEKEKETVERVLARKEKLEEKQRKAEERQRARAEQRLKEIEEKLEQTPESSEQFEALEEVETEQITPMLATDMTDIDGKDENAPKRVVGQKSDAADEVAATKDVQSEDALPKEEEILVPPEDALPKEEEILVPPEDALPKEEEILIPPEDSLSKEEEVFAPKETSDTSANDAPSDKEKGDGKSENEEKLLAPKGGKKHSVGAKKTSVEASAPKGGKSADNGKGNAKAAPKTLPADDTDGGEKTLMPKVRKKP